MAMEDPVMRKQRWRAEHVLRTPGQDELSLWEGPTCPSHSAQRDRGPISGKEKEEGYPMLGFSSHRIQ